MLTCYAGKIEESSTKDKLNRSTDICQNINKYVIFKIHKILKNQNKNIVIFWEIWNQERVVYLLVTLTFPLNKFVTTLCLIID